MTVAPLQIDTVAARATAQAWRSYATSVLTLGREVARRAAELALGSAAQPLTEPIRELADELDLASEVLELTARLAAEVGSGTELEVMSRLLEVAGHLRTALGDGLGERAVDLTDPTPVDARVTAHLGDIPLFGPGGPSIDDVNQAGLGDCWLEAVLAGVADSRPATIRTVVTDRGDGTYAVDLDGVRIVVDDEFPMSAGGRRPIYGTGPADAMPLALWPLVIQKAMALHAGGRYADLSGDDPDRALALFGEAGGSDIDVSWWFDPSDDDVLHDLQAALADGRPVIANSGGVFGMGGSHSWTVVATGSDGSGSPTVTVRNPWGEAGFAIDGGRLMRVTSDADGRPVWNPVDGVDPLGISIDGATVTMPLAVFADDFRDLDWLDRWD